VQRLAVIVPPVPTTVYQTPAVVMLVPQNGGTGASTVELMVLPAVMLLQATAIALAQRSLGGGQV